MLFQDDSFLDFHTHSMRQAHDNSVSEIVSIHLGQEKQHNYFTIGMHPWWTEEPISIAQRDALKQALLQTNCLAMGEMGLDNLKGPKLDVQIEIFANLLEIATEMKKPVIIHCVRAFDQLIQIKKQFPSISKWCVHGYGRHSTLAKQLIDQGFYLSLMPSREQKYQDWFQSLPNDRLFLETDSMPNVNIHDIYQKVVMTTGISLESLKKQMNRNATEFFQGQGSS